MAQEFVKATIEGNKVVIFSKPTCSFCIRAKDVLSKYKLKPGRLQIVDISAREDMGSLQDYFLELTGARTVPRVFIGQECVGGGSDVEALHASGKLEGMLQAIGALQ
ncbi:glutaredoxin-1 [Synchiropus splendidus]|uniref:glutaredoxin-1 n=1 Tax=Synchiropus splendidus TaxID=270530 RepID=UPI00237D8A36|nr:glutaredoxin-1 [Synchiropus splendidus]